MVPLLGQSLQNWRWLRTWCYASPHYRSLTWWNENSHPNQSILITAWRKNDRTMLNLNWSNDHSEMPWTALCIRSHAEGGPSKRKEQFKNHPPPIQLIYRIIWLTCTEHDNTKLKCQSYDGTEMTFKPQCASTISFWSRELPSIERALQESPTLLICTMVK